MVYEFELNLVVVWCLQMRSPSCFRACLDNRRHCWHLLILKDLIRAGNWRSEWSCQEAKLLEDTTSYPEFSVRISIELPFTFLVSFNFYLYLLDHNVVWNVDYLQDRCKGSTLYGFKGGPAGIMKCKYVVLTPEYIYPYRNQVRDF